MLRVVLLLQIRMGGSLKLRGSDEKCREERRRGPGQI
jgi:hypothetical protein